MNRPDDMPAGEWVDQLWHADPMDDDEQLAWDIAPEGTDADRWVVLRFARFLAVVGPPGVYNSPPDPEVWEAMKRHPDWRRFLAGDAR